MGEVELGGQQVFVVGSPPLCTHLPRQKNKGVWCRVGPRLLLMLVFLTVGGLLLQSVFIFKLWKRSQAFDLHPPFYLNLSGYRTADQQGGFILSRVGSKVDLNQMVGGLPPQVQQRPFAHLMGSSTPIGENNVVQWIHDRGDAVTRNMSYQQGRLVVERDGYYFLYSKVHMNAAAECSLILHKMMRETSGYGQALELMRSKSFHCRPPRATSKPPLGEDMWNSYLAGIFHLESGDKVFVTLENIHKVRPGPVDNFMGAFMILP